MSYSTYSDKDIIEIHNTTLDYSGKVDDLIMLEIESRGGLEFLNQKINKADIVPNEIKRIKTEAYKLYNNDSDIDSIKSTLTSQILKHDFLASTIDEAIEMKKSIIADRTITGRTVAGSIMGFIIGTLIGTTFWYFVAIKTGEVFHIFSHGVFFITYFVIKIFTKQTDSNTLVFLTSFASSLLSIILGYLVYINLHMQ